MKKKKKTRKEAEITISLCCACYSMKQNQGAHTVKKDKKKVKQVLDSNQASSASGNVSRKVLFNKKNNYFWFFPFFFVVWSVSILIPDIAGQVYFINNGQKLKALWQNNSTCNIYFFFLFHLPLFIYFLFCFAFKLTPCDDFIWNRDETRELYINSEGVELPSWNKSECRRQQRE